MKFPVPNKYISNYKSYDSFEFEIISQLCKRKDVNGYWLGSVKGLLNFSSIDIRYKNKTLQFLRSIGSIVDKDYVNVFVNGLFNIKSNKLSEYLLVDYDIYSRFDDKNLFKYYCFMLYHIRLFDSCYIQDYIKLIELTGMSKTTLLKYNSKLMDMKLIYYANSGDMYDESSDVIINSTNFYSDNLDIATQRMNDYVSFKSENYKFKKNYKQNEVDVNDKRRATQYINIYKTKETLTDEQRENLVWALELQRDIHKINPSDVEGMVNVKVNALVNRYKKSGFDFSYDDCYGLLTGDIKIIDLV